MSYNQRLVVVDDDDSRITYIGEWEKDKSGSQDELGNNGPTYRQTLHGTKGKYFESLSFQFNGTNVWAYGTTVTLPTSTNAATSSTNWQCYVDGQRIPVNYPSEKANNVLLCSGQYLDDGPHLFTLNITTQNQQFWFDSIRFAPSLVDSYKSSVLLVDNYDSAIKYQNGWVLSENSMPSHTQQADSRVRFDFTGIGLTWFGAILSNSSRYPTTAAYSIDNAEPVTFNVDTGGYNTTVDQHNIPLFATDVLPPGPHSIVVTYNGDSETMPLTLDYIYLSNTTTTIAATSKSVTLGAVIGGTIGGVVGLGLLVTMIFFLWKWRPRGRRRRKSGLVLPVTAPSPAPSKLSLEASIHNVTPWVMSQDGSVIEHEARRSSRKTSMLSPTPLTGHTTAQASPDGSQLELVSATRSPEDLLKGNAGQVGVDDFDASGTIRHRDSGIRLVEVDGDLLREIPPSYTPS